ncbi:hypothetical protein [Streptomyces sp. CC224B]|uniref:hypothetical protein n=1 Tax=Streptomyces sp. CC224B TaxID=3044571 RepID=UPI0024A934A2|nr:hypothetical protein [Streptomyces sp. CC224B]
MTAEAGGDRQVHRGPQRLVPGQDGNPDVPQQLRDPGPVRRRAGAGGEELHAQVVAEQRQDVQEPGGGRDVVDDQQHTTAPPPRRPPPGVLTDRYADPLLPRLRRLPLLPLVSLLPLPEHRTPWSLAHARAPGAQR